MRVYLYYNLCSSIQTHNYTNQCPMLYSLKIIHYSHAFKKKKKFNVITYYKFEFN